jgi:hypothetical protein
MTAPTDATPAAFPLPLDAYVVPDGAGLAQILATRLEQFPFNGVATLIFALAVLHTLFAKQFLLLAHHVQRRHDQRRHREGREPEPSVGSELLHFLGEVEAVFGLWVVVLLAAITLSFGWTTANDYVSHQVNYTEAIFVVVIMGIASTRPVVHAAEQALRRVAALGGGSVTAWWAAILTVGALLGSFITEPAAMTICALLLGRQFFIHGPSTRLRYATLGVLFVNVSIGGTLTHFAAPPVLMVARPWDWTLGFMAGTFGWKAALAVVASTALYLLLFRKDLRYVDERGVWEQQRDPEPQDDVPAWIVVVHLAFLAFVVVEAHYPVQVVGAFLFFLGFTTATAHYQSAIDLKAPLLVGFFLAGLVTHGTLQGWWIAPVLDSLGPTPLFGTAMVLTAFNDNALITFLATLVPDLDAAARYAVVAGAVAGGGLTVIANAPNPAGQALLNRYFEDGISPLGLLAGALLPTAVAAAAFLLI